MIITAQFTRDSLGVNSLTPTLTVVDVSDGAFVLDGVTMSPVANGTAPGWYKYDFTTYDDTVDYIITADAQTDLVDDRYPVTTVNSDAATEHRAACNTRSIKYTIEDNS